MGKRKFSLINFFNKFLSLNTDTKYLFNPIFDIHISALKNYRGITEHKRETQIIVSISSTSDHFKKLPITLYSLLNQSLKPDKIILWLDKEYEELAYLPYEISQFIKNGIEINFVKNLGLYSKTYHALKKYPDSIIVTASDSVYYRKNWLKKLYLSYISHPEDIHTHNVKIVELDKNFNKWKKKNIEEKASYNYFPISESGILYPPNCFSNEATREDIFNKHSKENDSLWFWTMALVHNKKIRLIKHHDYLLKLQKEKNINKQLENLLLFYGQNILNKIKKYS